MVSGVPLLDFPFWRRKTLIGAGGAECRALHEPSYGWRPAHTARPPRAVQDHGLGISPGPYGPIAPCRRMQATREAPAPNAYPNAAGGLADKEPRSRRFGKVSPSLSAAVQHGFRSGAQAFDRPRRHGSGFQSGHRHPVAGHRHSVSLVPPPSLPPISVVTTAPFDVPCISWTSSQALR